MYNTLSPHHPKNNTQRKIRGLQRIDSNAAVTAFLKELKADYPDYLYFKRLMVSTEQELELLIDMLNNPKMRVYGSLMNVQSHHQYWQSFSYVKSNLGRGYIFYFICDGCERRVKHLYMPDGSSQFLCRLCHRLYY